MILMTTNLQRVGRAGVPVVFAFALAAFEIAAHAQPVMRPDLVGRIVPPRGGSARATMIVFGASPKSGGAISSAYLDCGKRAQSDDKGDFKIESLDPQLRFRVLIVGPGCKPQVIDGLVPAEGAFTAYLEAADPRLTTTNSVRGRVVDAKGAPVADALVRLAGVRRDDRSLHSGTPLPGAAIAVTDAQGQFVLSSKDPYSGHPRAKVVEITAEIEALGFVRQKTAIEVGGPPTRIVLTKGGGMIEGSVVFPDGQPVEGAFVALKKDGKALNLRNGGLAGSPNDTIVATDAAGHFVLPSDPDATGIFASHPAGLGKVPATSSVNSGGTCKIGLQPWGRIEGTFRIGNRPGTNETIELVEPFPANFEDVSYAFGTTTDSEGRFVFTNVPPGMRQINRRIQEGQHSFLGEMLLQVEVKPGEVTQVRLGGSGRAIVGKVMILPPGEEVDWSLVRIGVSVDKRSYVANHATNGSFRVDDIPAGACREWVVVSEMGTGLALVVIGSVNRDILVPEMPGGRSDEPLDVGTIAVPIHHPPAVGVEAADFATKTLDGQPLKLSDYLGKFVLLDLAGKLPGPETPAVEAAAQAFSGATNFAIITLCNDTDPDFLVALSRKELHLVTGSLTNLNLLWYGVNFGSGGGSGAGFSGGGGDGLNLPAVFLIGPDGKYLSSKLKTKDIQPVVTAALGAK